MTKSDVLAAFARHRCSAILRTQHGAAAAGAMRAAIDGGFRVVEFTLNTPGALEHIAAFSARGDVVVGAGTVLSAADAERAVAAGARFIVSPVVDPEVIGWCRAHEVVAVPGASSPTEMLTAHRAGADLVKLFPGPAGGPSFVAACLGPLPFLKIFPTSGVTIDNAAEYLRAGAHGVGFVNVLFTPDDLAGGRFDAIRDRAAAMVATVDSAISPSSRT